MVDTSIMIVTRLTGTNETKFRSLVVASTIVFLPLMHAYGNGLGETIDYQCLSSRTYKTWLGVFAFSEEKILRIEGQTCTCLSMGYDGIC